MSFLWLDNRLIVWQAELTFIPNFWYQEFEFLISAIRINVNSAVVLHRRIIDKLSSIFFQFQILFRVLGTALETLEEVITLDILCESCSNLIFYGHNRNYRIVAMTLIVYRRTCTLTIEWPAGCHDGFSKKFIVVVDDVESGYGYRMVTTPLPADSRVLRVGIPDYFSSSAYGLVVTLHLCDALMDEAGWKTVESLTTCAVPFDCEDYACQFDCDHGPTSMQNFLMSIYNLWDNLK